MKMIVFGTRPEIIKLYPLIKALPDGYLVWTGQHDKLGNQLLKEFNITPNEDLKVMVERQSLTSLTIKLHQTLSDVYKRKQPELVIVQGDTTSAMVASLEAFYHKIPVAHIEAGLRTRNIYSPFPEEVNRRIITQIAKYNFTPTIEASSNVELEGWGEIIKVGQTGIDTLLEFSKKIKVKKKKKLLITLHRRENFDKIQSIADKIIRFLIYNPEWEAVMPIHPNPVIRKAIHESNLGSVVKLIEPLGYLDMIREMKESSLIITDSGGIQEEAPSLGIPVLVARKLTERPEGIKEGFAKFLDSEIKIFKVPRKKNPYGDGKATERILEWLV